MCVSAPSAAANDKTGLPRPVEDVDHQVKGAVARPDSTGCPTVELELNWRFDGEWERKKNERNGNGDGEMVRERRDVIQA